MVKKEEKTKINVVETFECRYCEETIEGEEENNKICGSAMIAMIVIGAVQDLLADDHLPPGSTPCCNRSVCSVCLMAGKYVWSVEEEACLYCLRSLFKTKHPNHLVDSDCSDMDSVIEELYDC
jgi:hypothetical protein